MTHEALGESTNLFVVASFPLLVRMTWPLHVANRGKALKRRVQVTFVNQHGVEEAGIDGGGVFKEYMDLLTKRAFDPQYALFLATEDQVGWVTLVALLRLLRSRRPVLGRYLAANQVPLVVIGRCRQTKTTHRETRGWNPRAH